MDSLRGANQQAARTLSSAGFEVNSDSAIADQFHALPVVVGMSQAVGRQPTVTERALTAKNWPEPSPQSTFGDGRCRISTVADTDARGSSSLALPA